MMNYFSFLLVVALFFPFVQKSQSIDSIVMQQQLVVKNFQAYHIQPPFFNEKTNKEIVDLFIERADPRGLFVFKEDVEVLKKCVSENSSNDGYPILIAESCKLFKKRKHQIDSIVKIMEAKPFVFTSKDSITFLAKEAAPFFCQSTHDLKRRIDKRLRYDCLNILIKPTKENEDVLKLNAQELSLKQAEATKKVFTRFKRYIDNFNSDKQIHHYIGDCLSNAIAARCDPHSTYFNSYEKEKWDAGLSAEELSFGFYADENEQGEIIISDLVPGGAAWKSNELHEGDVILGFQFEKEEYIDLTNSEVEDFYTLFYKSSSLGLEITIRRKDNQIKKIKLQKAKLQSQENVMNSYLIKVSNKKYGYIPIPAFYTDFESNYSLGCANDVAKEIIKLKQDSIKGLILDLRYNGGGSMKEAMDLSGIFIDEGPLAIYKSKAPKPSLLKDFNRGTIYDGPLVVLINGYSASASEFLAATLQDYERALIIGSTSYGKGTAQIVFPVDSTNYKNNRNTNSSYGYVKVTEGKFYRVTNASHQGRGIIPDVRIPDVMERFAEKESDEHYFLPNDSVVKKVIFNKLSALPKNQIKEKSSARVHSKQQFVLLQHLLDSLYSIKNQNLKLILTLKDVKKYDDEQKVLSSKLENAIFLGDSDEMLIKNNQYMQKLISFDEYQRKINEKAIEGLKKDLILQEASFIIDDLYHLQKK